AKMFYRIYKLTMMQLGEKLDLGKLRDKKGLIKTIAQKVMGLILLSMVIFVLLYLLRSFLFIRVDIKFLILVLMSLQIFSIITSTSGLIQSMYLAKDNQLLFSYPAKPNEIFMSKIAVFLAYELLRNITYLVPFLLAFGLAANIGASVSYYLLILPAIVLLSIISILIGVLISIPITFISKWLKERPLIAASFVFLILIAIFYPIFNFINSLPTNFSLVAMYGSVYNQITFFIDTVIKFGLYVITIAKVLLSVNFINNLLTVLGVISSLIVLTYFISRPIYFKMAVNSYEFSNKRKYKMSKNTLNKPFLSFISKEFKLLRRSSGSFISNLITLITLPIVLYVLNSLIGMFDIVDRGQHLMITFNIFLGLTVLLSANSSSATAFSKEADRAYLLKVAPISIKKQAMAKIFFNLILSVFVLILTSIVIAYTTNISGINMLFMFILFSIINVGHILWSLEIDFMDPQFKVHETNEDSKENKNIAKSVSIGIVVALLTGIVSLMLFRKSFISGWINLIVLATLFLSVRIYLFINRLQVYFKRIEF
ncbi:TPA: hypothetical protein GXZ34_01750, partial [bacterium]|nr:hypothetical protein [bacterium]